MIGVKPLFSGKSLGEGENAGFDVIVAAPDGKQLAASGLRYELLKIERRYQYYRRDGRWEYEPVKSTRRMTDGRIDVAADKPGRISLPVTWGRYRLDVASDDRSIPPTSVTFDAGFYSDASADTPDLLEIALDKSEYAAGDTMTVAVTARTRRQGHAQRRRRQAPVDRDRSTCRPVPRAFRSRSAATGARRLCGGNAAPSARRGGKPHARPRHRRAMVLGRPQGAHARLRHAAAEPDAAERPAARAGEAQRPCAPARRREIVVAAVDVGILNLTNYKPPAPDDYYLGQRRLTAEIRDLYGQLLDGMQGTRGAIRTGGDGAGAALGGTPPTQPPLALYSGIVTVKPDGCGRSAVRHSGVRRHRARDGGRVVQGQGRQGLRRRHRARSGRAHRDAAALPAHRRPRHRPPRPRQCRRSGRRLRDQRADRRAARRSGRRRRPSGSPASSAPASACRSTRPRSASAMWRSSVTRAERLRRCSAAIRWRRSPRRRS